MSDDIEEFRKNNTIDWDDAPDGSDGGYDKNGNFINSSAMREIVLLRKLVAAKEAKIAELTERCADYENEIAEACPEDYSVKETVDALNGMVSDLKGVLAGETQRANENFQVVLDLQSQLAEARGEAIKDILKIVDPYLPRPAHLGSCGPESGCDMLCMEAAAVSQAIVSAQAESERKG